jgi:hypothetical protein
MNARTIFVLLLAVTLSGCLQGQVEWAAAPDLVDGNPAMVGFQKTLYKFVRNKTCIGCHEAGPGPLFANNNPVVAYDVAFKKVNFSAPEVSPFYLKVKKGHNCWYGGDCNASAQDLKKQIYAWREYVNVYTADMGVVTATLPFLPNGLNLPQGSFLFEAEAGRRVSLSSNLRGLQRLSITEDKVASKGKYLYVADKGNTFQPTLDISMSNYAELPATGTPEFNAPKNVTYDAWVRIGSSTDGRDRFELQLNNNTPQTIAVDDDDTLWHWQRVGVGASKPCSASAADCPNTFKVGVRDEGPKMDLIFLLPTNLSGNLTEDQINEKIGRRNTLVFDLRPILVEAKAKYDMNNPGSMVPNSDLDQNLVVTLSQFDEEAYIVESARIVSRSSTARVKNLDVAGVRWMMNGTFNPQDSDWVTVDKVIPSAARRQALCNDGNDATPCLDVDTYQRLADSPMLVQIQKGNLVDQIAVAFTRVQFTNADPGTIEVPLDLTPRQTVVQMLNSYCINCHSNLDSVDRTLFVVKDENFDLNEAETLAWLTGTSTTRDPAHVRRSHEKLMRPKVRLADGSIAYGSGAEGSAIYRVWNYRERTPAEMLPYVNALNNGSPEADALLAKLKAYIDSIPEVDGDSVKPRLEAISGVEADIDRDGKATSTLSFDAFDDATAVASVQVRVQRNSSTNQTNRLVSNGIKNAAGVFTTDPNPRRFNGEMTFAPDAGADLRTNNYRFVVNAVDEAGNLSETTRIGNMDVPSRPTMQSTIGNCDIGISAQVNGDSANGINDNTLDLGGNYALTAHAQNLFALAGETLKFQILRNGTAIANFTDNSTMGANKITVNDTYTVEDTADTTLTVRVSNGTNAQTPDPINPYECTKSISYNSSVNLTIDGADGAAGSRTITAIFRSAIRGNVRSIVLNERRQNSATVFPRTANSVITADGGYQNRKLTYVWPGTRPANYDPQSMSYRDGDQHTFTITVTDALNRTFTDTITNVQ